ncbi:MAG TPA: hypothetical protein G4N98_03205 [Thermoflexia bacterium]|nr:hypothetical protein [Thermoflexia bacterium]
MGKLTARLNDHRRIALDTSIFIYHLEFPGPAQWLKPRATFAKSPYGDCN